MKTGIKLITEERQRQIEKEGWTAEHDAKHKNGELAIAAACYAYPNYDEDRAIQSQLKWPWLKYWWKPSGDRKRDLVKAGALIAAEIDRLNPDMNKEELLNEATELIQYFVDRVEKGSIRSRTTYAKYKTFLKKVSKE